MSIITLAEVKTYRGITTSDFDAQITAYLPIIDAKVKQITGNRFNYRVIGELTLDSKSALLASINDQYNRFYYEDLQDYLQTGTKITGTGIPDGTYIEEVFYNLPNGEINDQDNIPQVTLSQAVTESVSGGTCYLGINIAYLPTIAAGVMWLIDTQTSNGSNSLSGKSMGPVSVQYSQADQQIDNRYGMPAWFVKALPVYHRGH
jgi:hypothetical protein